ncbi:uncharacterized protein LOC135471034 [Liolophura sinensis]|uniref:uncharacterized protein LOC135471034 n=1 Tax=Liolophura sinensis TaxID=3198878 RepID=UPI003158118B
MLNPNLMLIFIALQIPSADLSQCPYDVVTEVFSCLANVTSFEGQSTIAGGDVHILEGNCWNGGFERVTLCVESLFANCNNKKDVEVLNKLVSVVAIRSAFSDICRRLEIYANSSECMKTQNIRIQSCIDEEYKRFHNSLNEIQDIIKEYCKYSWATSGCIERPVRHSCNPGVADLLVSFMGGLTPPMCNSATTFVPDLKFRHNNPEKERASTPLGMASSGNLRFEAHLYGMERRIWP